ncbi:MAG: histidine phosphatase family protein [Proteobacteria bacterium]|nr:histidine phosphatase family protein [Pseudomonadota bacterium]
MTLLLIRHGETALNATRVLQPADTPLGPRGLAQAEALARRVAPMDIAGILSSDLPRAMQTAQAIAATTGCEIRTSTLLQERNFGDLRGRPYDALGFDPLTMETAPPGGESSADFGARVRTALSAALEVQRAVGGCLAVVTHGLVIGRLLTDCLRLGPGMLRPASISNTSITIVGVTPPYVVELLDSTSHLDAGGLREGPRSLSGG